MYLLSDIAKITIFITVNSKSDDNDIEENSSRTHFRDFPDGPVVKESALECRDMGSVPGWGTKIPHAMEQLSKKERKIII